MLGILRSTFPRMLAILVIAASASAQPPRRPPVAERIAAVPDLDKRLAALETALNAAADRNSLSATTARFVLELMKEVKADPAAFDNKMKPPAPRPQQEPAAAPRPATPPPPPKPVGLSKKHADYVATAGISIDFDKELKRAEQLAADVNAGRNPAAGATGESYLAYRSELDGVLMPYRIYVPTTYDKSRPYPLIVFLHGANSDENSYMAMDVLQPPAEQSGYLIAAINGRGAWSMYRKEGGEQQDLLDVIALMQKYYNVDPGRIYLVGHSLGGISVWRTGFELRDRFAALASIAGTVPMPDIDQTLASGWKIPMLITHGGQDTGVPPGPGIEAYRKLRQAGYPAKVVVYPEDGHGPVIASSMPEVFGWFDKYRK